MKINVPLFDSQHVCLAPIDHEKDAEIESRWTHDAAYLQMLSADPARPQPPDAIKKIYESIEEEMEKSKSMFYFTIRMRTDDRLIGFAKLYWIEWSNGSGKVQMGLGASKDRGRGYGAEALAMLLRYAFAELNLHRLTAEIQEYNAAAIGLFKKCGFVDEVRRRQALNRFGRRWDALHLGILRQEWEDQERSRSIRHA